MHHYDHEHFCTLDIVHHLVLSRYQFVWRAADTAEEAMLYALACRQN